MSDELKPCPFCKSGCLYETQRNGYCDYTAVMFCNRCKAIVTWEQVEEEGVNEKTRQFVREHWNTRANEPHEYEPYEPDDSHECASCGCVVDYDVHDDGSWAIMANDYQIPYRFCPQCGADVHADDTPELPQDDACAILRKNLYDVGDLGRAMGILEPNELVGGSGDRAYIFECLADLIERDYVRRDSIADDAPISEKPAPSLKESTEDTQTLTDSRERLLDYIWREITTTLRDNGRLHDPNFWYANIVSWLDRQAAITTAECTSEDASCCEACRAAQKRKIAELTAERDELQSIIDHMPKTEAECEACQEAHDRMMFLGGMKHQELQTKVVKLAEKLDEKQHVCDVQRDSFLKMERECAELRRMLADAAEAI